MEVEIMSNAVLWEHILEKKYTHSVLRSQGEMYLQNKFLIELMI